jgi:hypothetical protein
MDETYRMLGREHEADLERDALKWRRAAEARGSRCDPANAPGTECRSNPKRLFLAMVVAHIARIARTVPFVAR